MSANLGHRASFQRSGLLFMICSLSLALLVIPASPTAKTDPAVVTTEASDACTNSAPSASIICPVLARAYDTYILFIGCLSSSNACTNPFALKITDSALPGVAGLFWRVIGNVTYDCGGSCFEIALISQSFPIGNSVITITGASAFYGADFYDVSGLNANQVISSYGFAHPEIGQGPGVISFTPIPGSFVAAGVIANSAGKFTAGANYTLIPNQPCYSCGKNGGWQASEYDFWGTGGTSQALFGYPTLNEGWVEVAVSVAPYASMTAVSCGKLAVGVPSQCKATVTGQLNPSGTVTWSSDGKGTFSESGCTLANSTCAVTYEPLAAGPVTITATYGGDTYNFHGYGQQKLGANRGVTTLKVACSPSPAAVNSATICTASVNGTAPTGTVVWASSGVANFTPAASCTLVGGSCAVDYTPPSLAPVMINANYSGDDNNLGSSATLGLSVTQGTATTSVTQASTSATGSTTSLTATPYSSSSSFSSSSSTSSSVSASQSSLALNSGYLGLLLVVALVASTLLARSPLLMRPGSAGRSMGRSALLQS